MTDGLLKLQKLEINKEMEESRVREKSTLNNLQNTLYEMQRKMQNLQSELEKVILVYFNDSLQISEKNSALEQDFENEINKKNKNSKEIGQIINSINNIYNICKEQQKKRNKIKKQRMDDVSETTENLVEALIKRLEFSSEVIEDLVEVFKIIDYTYDVSFNHNHHIHLERQSLH